MNHFNIEWQKKQLQLLDTEFSDILSSNDNDDNDDNESYQRLFSESPSKQRKQIKERKETNINNNLNWRLLHSDLDKTLQETKNILSSKEIKSYFNNNWYNELKWNFNLITNIEINKWSKKVFKLEQLSQNNVILGNKSNNIKIQSKIKQNQQTKLHILLTNLYFELNSFSINMDKFIHITLKWIISKYKLNDDYLHHLQYEYLPKIWNIMTLYQQYIIQSKNIIISKSNFIQHFEIILTQNNFINACKKYINYLKKMNNSKESIIPFNPDILRLSAIIISKINFENHYILYYNKNNVFLRLHQSGMKQKFKRKKQFEVNKLMIDNECTFKPRITKYAQRKKR